MTRARAAKARGRGTGARRRSSGYRSLVAAVAMHFRLTAWRHSSRTRVRDGRGGDGSAMAVASAAAAIDEMRTALATRYMAGRIAATRIDALRRGTAVGLRFEAAGDDYMFAAYEDGNGNGVRTAEIRAGVDRAVGPFERLGSTFPAYGSSSRLAFRMPTAVWAPAPTAFASVLRAF